MVLDEDNSSFITYEISPVIYTFKDISEVLLNLLQTDYKGDFNKIVIELDDTTRKTKLVARPGIKAIRFDKKLFFFVLFLVLLQVGIMNIIMNTLARKL